MQILLVRHGEAQWNVSGRLMGQLDSPLTPLGIEQSRSVAVRLAGMEFDSLYSSDLGRAWQTAEIIAAAVGKPARAEPRLREGHAGIMGGLTREEIVRNHAAAYEAYWGGDADSVVPGGESRRQLCLRVMDCLIELAHRHAGRRVVAVTHGGVLDCVFRHVVGLPLTAPRTFKLFNAALHALHFEAGRWMLGTWGDIGHLSHTRTLDG